jgi:DNA-binding MarR family transcriptional regulator
MDSTSVDDLLLQRISRLLATAGGMVTRLCEGRFGITRREWRVLAVLVQEQGVLPSQLADRMQLDRARTSRAISSLVGKGLVVREPRPGNRREVVLTVTDKGQGIHDAMVPLAVEINRRLIAALTPQDAQRLDVSLDLLQTCADTLVAQADLPKADRRRGTHTQPD